MCVHQRCSHAPVLIMCVHQRCSHAPVLIINVYMIESMGLLYDISYTENKYSDHNSGKIIRNRGEMGVFVVLPDMEYNIVITINKSSLLCSLHAQC